MRALHKTGLAEKNARCKQDPSLGPVSPAEIVYHFYHHLSAASAREDTAKLTIVAVQLTTG